MSAKSAQRVAAAFNRSAAWLQDKSADERPGIPGTEQRLEDLLAAHLEFHINHVLRERHPQSRAEIHLDKRELLALVTARVTADIVAAVESVRRTVLGQQGAAELAKLIGRTSKLIDHAGTSPEDREEWIDIFSTAVARAHELGSTLSIDPPGDLWSFDLAGYSDALVREQSYSHTGKTETHRLMELAGRSRRVQLTDPTPANRRLGK
jgi:hypothetical protein